MLISIKSILPRILNRLDKRNKTYSISVADVSLEIIKEILGEDLVNFIEIPYYQNNILFIKCKNSSISLEIHLKKEEILNKLNQKLSYFKRKKIEKIIFI